MAITTVMDARGDAPTFKKLNCVQLYQVFRMNKFVYGDVPSLIQDACWHR
eukprot:CAMPEP_0172754596 /NCGR_PEP_ID=MMETSP1074-20121228/158239_1 /TAXON_ID=2916 /ORGANISM="Ceratium fusus, Strain PA161109" /LENGTH=49 /DNA_ID= /DNA_START= /DNA_END= /DNA_ORIENTATION=